MSETTVTVRNALLILLAVLLQTSWVNSFALWDVRPDVVLLVVVFIGITGGQIAATVFGFVSGFLLDVYDPESMGLNSLANSVVGFLWTFGFHFASQKRGSEVSKKILKGCWVRCLAKGGLWRLKIGAKHFTNPGHDNTLSCSSLQSHIFAHL